MDRPSLSQPDEVDTSDHTEEVAASDHIKEVNATDDTEEVEVFHQVEEGSPRELARYSRPSLEGSRIPASELAHGTNEHASVINLTEPLLTSTDRSGDNTSHGQRITSEEDEVHESLDQEAMNIYPTSKNAEIVSSKEGSLVDNSIALRAKPTNSHAPWVLSRLFLIALMLTFLSLIVVLEILYYVSNNSQGISTSTQSRHYLWTYGPTAAFSAFAIFWGKIEYHTKLLMPWKMLSTKPQLAKDSLLLDYVSPNQPVALYKSIRRKHYPVAVATLGSILIVAATVVSTGLFVLQRLTVKHDKAKMNLQDQFDLNLFNSSLVDSVPTLLAFGILGNLSLPAPAGTNKDYAVQSFNLSEPFQGTNITMTTTTDAFSADLECSAGQMTNATLVADSALDQVLVNLTAGSCNSGQTAFALPAGSASEGVYSLGWVVLVQCLDDIEVADKRSAEHEPRFERREDILEESLDPSSRESLSATSNLLSAPKTAISTITTSVYVPSTLEYGGGLAVGTYVKTATITIFSTPPTSTPTGEFSLAIVFAQFAHPKDFIEQPSELSGNMYSATLQNFTTIPLGAEDLNATVLFCKPTYRVDRASVTLDASGSLLNITQVASNQASTNTSIPAWDLVLAFIHSVRLSFANAPQDAIIPEEVASGWLYVPDVKWGPTFNLLEAISPSRPISELLEPLVLESEVRQLFRTSSAQTAKRYMTGTSDLISRGTRRSVVFRLVIHEVSLRLLETLLVALAACSLAMVILNPAGLVPGDPSALGRIATILARSTLLMTELTRTGDQGLKILQDRMQGLRFEVPNKTSGQREGYQIQSTPPDESTRVSNEDDRIGWWQPLAFKLLMKITILALPPIVITVLEVTYQISRRSHGLGDVGDSAYIHFTWTLIPALLLTCLKLLLQTVAWSIQLLDPFRVLKDGSSNARASLFCNHLRKSGLELFYKSVVMRRLALFATAILMMIGPFLTIVVSGLFSTQLLPETNTIDVGLVDQVSLSPYNALWQPGALAVANLLIRGDSSYPDGTYDNIVYPNIGVLSSSASSLARNTTLNATSLSVEMQSLRPNMSCIAVDPAHVFYNFTSPSPGVYDFSLTYLELASGCNCANFRIGGCESLIYTLRDVLSFNGTSFSDYFEGIPLQPQWSYPHDWRDPAALTEAKTTPFFPTCPNITAVYGNIDQASLAANLTVIACSWNLELVSANVTYDLQENTTYSVQVGKVLNSSANSYWQADNNPGSYPFESSTINGYVIDDFVRTAEESGLPSVFMALLNGSALSETFTSENAANVAESLQFIYNTFAAQYLNNANRGPATTISSAVANITMIDRERLVQSAISTRILEGLLAAMWLCAVVVFIFFDSRELLPKNPCSIAAQASLFADSELLGLIPHGAEGLSDEELLQTQPFKGYFFSLGWWGHGGDGSRQRFGVDVGKPEGSDESQ